MISSVNYNNYSAYQSFFKQTGAKSGLSDLIDIKHNKENYADMDISESASEENYSHSRLSGLRNKTLLDVMNEKGLTNQKLSQMPWSEKVITENEISNEVYSRVKSSVKNQIMNNTGGGFLRGERLSQEVISTLLVSI